MNLKGRRTSVFHKEELWKNGGNNSKFLVLLFVHEVFGKVLGKESAKSEDCAVGRGSGVHFKRGDGPGFHIRDIAERGEKSN